MTRYNTTIADEICRRLGEGESLNAICKDDGFPAESTVRSWALDDYEGFSAKYTRAREIQAHTLADQIIDIGNTPVEGSETTTKANGDVETKVGDMLGHRKLQIDSRKWYLSKVLPKVYGDKLETTVKGELKVTSATELTDDELAAIASKRSA